MRWSPLVRLWSRLQDHVASRPCLDHCRVLDRDLLLRRGTVPMTEDYDDAWIVACAQHASTVFDIGANVGYSALLALLAGPKQHLLIVDANEDALAIAAENLIRNRLAEPATFVSCFVSDELESSQRFWTMGTGQAGSACSGHARTAAESGNVREVPTTTIDALADRFGVVPEFIKIDVEGAESNVLKGSLKCATLRETRMLVEMHSTPDLGMYDNASSVLAWCDTVGYRAWYPKTNEKLHVPDTIQHRGRCHLLLQPVDWPYPQWLREIDQGARVSVALASSLTRALKQTASGVSVS